MGNVTAVLDQGYEQIHRVRNGLIDKRPWLIARCRTVPEISRRPSTAPAYYLGRPAHLWITVMRPRTTSRPGPA